MFKRGTDLVEGCQENFPDGFWVTDAHLIVGQADEVALIRVSPHLVDSQASLTMLLMQSYQLEVLITFQNSVHVPQSSERRDKWPRYIVDRREVSTPY